MGNRETEQWREQGLDVARRLWGERAEGKELPAQRLAPDLFAWVAEAVFGGIWARPGLDIRSRSLCTIAMLAALGKHEELVAHVAGALHLGISREEVIEVLMQVACYAGVPASVSALNASAPVLGGTR